MTALLDPLSCKVTRILHALMHSIGINTKSTEGLNNELLTTTDLIVTTTANACDKHMLTHVKSAAVICNIGHFDNEIDTKFLLEKFEWQEMKPQAHKIFRDSKDEDC